MLFMQELRSMKDNKQKKRLRKKTDFIKAKRNLDEMQRTIQPFINPSNSKRVTTAGQWYESSSLDEMLIIRR